MLFRVELGEVNGKFVNATISWKDESGEDNVEIVTTEKAMELFCRELEACGYTEQLPD